ncbi:DUF5677 domain-containing protein [Aliivibrio sp. 1S128]|uniref:DUF5677 domain-containing protein n=1 Tax=Aliivibrio sp. 1S128 TaxID=1840085 RepID=UPI00080E9D61|nr:DUF5677 domain-containing protein [Aliivibrio sp. 1S128]OCH19964.1 hypothetical protein A6E03_19520 [Aliivibrio sp. 1S128]
MVYAFGEIHRQVEQEESFENKTEDEINSFISEVAKDFLNDSLDALGDSLTSRRETQSKIWKYWGSTFNLFDFYIASNLDIASMYRESVLKTDSCLDLRFVVLTQLHAKSVLVLREIQALIEAGYPDGAITRWRTLHELAVCSCVIFESEKSARYYLLSEHIKNAKGAKCYSDHASKLNHEPYTESELESIASLKAVALKELGDDYNSNSDYFWAMPFLLEKGYKGNRPNLYDLEVKVCLDHYRPYFTLACEKIHAPSKSNYANLAISGHDRPGLVVGPSHYGYETPIDLAMLSSLIILSKFIFLFPTLDSSIFLKMISLVQEKVLESAFETKC